MVRRFNLPNKDIVSELAEYDDRESRVPILFVRNIDGLRKRSARSNDSKVGILTVVNSRCRYLAINGLKPITYDSSSHKMATNATAIFA